MNHNLYSVLAPIGLALLLLIILLLVLLFLYKVNARRLASKILISQINLNIDMMEDSIKALKSLLKPWSADNLADLSSDWDAEWSRWGKNLTARGIIPSLRHPESEAYIVFGLKIKGVFNPEGVIYAANSQSSFRYELLNKRIGIFVNEDLLGYIEEKGKLLNTDEVAIGEAIRPGGLPLKIKLGKWKIEKDTRNRSYPVYIKAKNIGEIANPPIKDFNTISLKKISHMPAALPEDSIDEQELLWLSAIAIFQVAGLNLMESIWTNINV